MFPHHDAYLQSLEDGRKEDPTFAPKPLCALLFSTAISYFSKIVAEQIGYQSVVLVRSESQKEKIIEELSLSIQDRQKCLENFPTKDEEVKEFTTEDGKRICLRYYDDFCLAHL